MMVEVLLKLLVAEVDAELLESIVLEGINKILTARANQESVQSKSLYGL